MITTQPTFVTLGRKAKVKVKLLTCVIIKLLVLASYNKLLRKMDTIVSQNMDMVVMEVILKNLAADVSKFKFKTVKLLQMI